MTQATNLDIPEYRLEQARKLVNRYARKAEKRGETPPSLEVVDTWTRYYLIIGHDVVDVADRKAPPSWATRARAKGRGHVMATSFVTVAVTGVRPIIAGHRFRATLQLTEGGTVLRSLPCDGDVPPIPARYRSSTSSCDHCKTHRRRKDVYLLEKVDDSSFIQVGRQCLQEYLGGADPSAWLSAQTIDAGLLRLSSYDYGDGEASSVSERAVSVLTFLAGASCEIRREGYRRRGSEGTSTATLVWYALTDSDPKNVTEFLSGFQKKDWDNARLARAWMLGEDDDQGDYRHNLRVSARMDWMPVRQSGLLASGMQAYFRHVGQCTAKAEPVKEHLPNAKPGDRVEMDVSVSKFTGWDTVYGRSYLLLFADEDGRVVAWKTSNPPNVEVGDRVRIRGTVKSLGDYKGTPQTVLTRVRVWARD